MSVIITPDHPMFSRWLSVPPPNWKEERANVSAFAITPDSGVLVGVTEKQLDEFIFDAGLYWNESESEDDSSSDSEDESFCYYPDYLTNDH